MCLEMIVKERLQVSLLRRKKVDECCVQSHLIIIVETHYQDMPLKIKVMLGSS